MALFIKNNSGTDGSWAGQLILDGEYILTDTASLSRFSNDDNTIASIGNGDLVVAPTNDGSADLGAAAGVNSLLGNLPTHIADPFPDNTGDWSFRGLGGSATLNGSGTNGGVTNIDVLMSEKRYIDSVELWIADDTLYGMEVDFIVADKDGVGVTLGWYDQATFDAMGNYFAVEQFGYSWQLPPKGMANPKPGYLAAIPSGLYVRMAITNPNAASTTAYYNFYLHKKAT